MHVYKSSWPNEVVMRQWCRGNLIEKFECIDQDHKARPMTGCMKMKRDRTKWNDYMNADECNTI